MQHRPCLLIAPQEISLRFMKPGEGYSSNTQDLITTRASGAGTTTGTLDAPLLALFAKASLKIISLNFKFKKRVARHYVGTLDYNFR